jgi:hypothetical protein
MSERLLPSVLSLIDQRIAEAQRNGEFDNLPGAGKPLDLDDDAHVPEEDRAAYRLLKNSGFVPTELAEISEVNALLAQIERQEFVGTTDGALDSDVGRRLRAPLVKLELAGRPATAANAWRAYEEALKKKAGAD